MPTMRRWAGCRPSCRRAPQRPPPRTNGWPWAPWPPCALAPSLSSNRADHAAGTYGGAGWVISPDGALLARTTAEQPFCTVDIDLNAATTAHGTYPRYVFAHHPPRTTP